MSPFFLCLSVMAEEVEPNISFLKGDYLRALESYKKLSEKNVFKDILED